MKFPKIPRDLRRNEVATSEVIAQIKEMRSRGLSMRKIAAELHIGFATVQRHLQTPEKRLAELQRNREFNKKWREEHPASKEKRREAQKQTRRYRKDILGATVQRYVSATNTKERYKNASPEKLLSVYQWHKQQIENLLDVDPLLILFSSKQDRIAVTSRVM